MSKTCLMGAQSARPIMKSCTFNGTDEYMSVSAPSATFGAAVFSFWINPTDTTQDTFFESFVNASNLFRLTSNSNDIEIYLRVGGVDAYNIASTDNSVTTGAWNHICVTVTNLSSVSSADKVKLFINGTRKTLSGNGNGDPIPITGATFRVGANQTPSNYFKGSIAEAICCLPKSGVTLATGTPESVVNFFGKTTSGSWKPKPIIQGSDSSNYPAFGFRLRFLDSASMGKDVSGNGLNFTLTNMDSTNQSTSVP